jgi:hypothetical protein
MGKELQPRQGTLDMLILKAVSLGPLHGYGILLRIEQISKAGDPAGVAVRGVVPTGGSGLDQQRVRRIGEQPESKVPLTAAKEKIAGGDGDREAEFNDEGVRKSGILSLK